jgi:hypothetical protein
VWYVDDMKISHVNSSVVDHMINMVKQEFGKELDITICRGKIHDYLGVQFDFSQKGKVVMSMCRWMITSKSFLRSVPTT